MVKSARTHTRHTGYTRKLNGNGARERASYQLCIQVIAMKKVSLLLSQEYILQSSYQTTPTLSLSVSFSDPVTHKALEMYKYQMCHLSDLYHENKLPRPIFHSPSGKNIENETRA